MIKIYKQTIDNGKLFYSLIFDKILNINNQDLFRSK